MTAPMAVPEVKSGSLNSRRFTAGTLARSSRQTKRARATKANRAQATMSLDSNQSFCCPSSRKYCSEASPVASRVIPSQSMLRRWWTAALA